MGGFPAYFNKGFDEAIACCLITLAIGSFSVPDSTLLKVPINTVGYGPFNLFDANSHSIIAPAYASQIQIIGHLEWYPTLADGACSTHLFRNDDITSEAFYHNRIPYLKNISAYTNTVAMTPWIPILYPLEKWSLYAFQNTGLNATLITVAGAEN